MKNIEEMNEAERHSLALRIETNEKLGQETWFPVSFMAHAYGVSARRMRVLLAEGRIRGRQLENGYWEVAYPPRLRIGRRGPQMNFLRPKAAKKPELKVVGK
ncbi:MAG: hypothetical protein Q7T38_06250 [Gallionella sp.]|nr:hypothetical protein [Gallionella sp.]